MISHDPRGLIRTLIALSDRPALYWASVCGFHPSNVSSYLRGWESLSGEKADRLLSVLSLDPETLKLDPSRTHVWIVELHEPETLTDAAEAFLEHPITMALVSPDPNGPASLSQAPQAALLRAGNIRIVLLRKLLPAKMSGFPSQKTGSPWIRPSMIPGARWKASEISPDEDAPPLAVPGPFLFDLVMGNVSIEEFDALMDKSAPWNWKDVEALAKKSGLTARDVVNVMNSNGIGTSKSTLEEKGMEESVRCARCREVLIREEEEDGNLCFECFEAHLIETPRVEDSPDRGKVRQKLQEVPSRQEPSGYPMEKERIGDIGNDEEAPLYQKGNRNLPKKTEASRRAQERKS
ncbi:MAG: hypothetical protein ACYCYP_02990 [Leptospirales bacterium]